MADGVVLFHSIHPVFVLEKELASRNVTCKPVPVPRHLSSDCGTALRFPLDRRGEIEAAARELGLEIARIVALDEEQP